MTRTLADQNIEMATERAYEMAKFLGRQQGVLVGVSAAAATAAAVQWPRQRLRRDARR